MEDNIFTSHIEREILRKLNQMSTQLDALTAQVQANTTLEGSATTMIQGIAAQIAAAVQSGDSTQLTQLASQLQASATALSAAVVANTPVVVVPSSTTVGSTIASGTTVTAAPTTASGSTVPAVVSTK